MRRVNKNKNVLVGVCGGVSSYKTCELVRLFVKDGFSTKVMMTEAAAKLVTPLLFQTLSGNNVYIDLFRTLKEESIQHISLAQWADICVIAPLSANSLSKVAVGICDNLLTTVLCSFPGEKEVLFAPAMNENMWNNPIIKENIEKLKKIKGYNIITPRKGELACGIWGEGRMPEPEDIFMRAKSALGK